MSEALIVDMVRTPIGRYAGALAAVRPDDLAASVIGAAVQRTGADPAQIDDVYMGCTNAAGEDNRNVARRARCLPGCRWRCPASRSTVCARRVSRPWPRRPARSRPGTPTSRSRVAWSR